MTISSEEINQICEKTGLWLAGISSAKPLEDARAHLADWQEKGFAAEMGYMKRDPALFVTPQRILEGAQTVISVAVPYGSKPHKPLPPGYGRIARYAWGRDYHTVLGKRLSLLQAELSVYGETRAFTDAVPLLERAFAAKAGLGFVGKNSLLITPGIGSNFFIAEVLASFSVAGIPAPKSFAGCRSCVRCMSQCPTGAIVSDRVVDARRCISYLTIEKRDAFSTDEARMVGEWLFGCDICQDVCPFNYKALKNNTDPDLEAFGAAHGAGPVLSLTEILSIRDDETFRRRFAGTPLLRAKRRGLVRNACAVAVNCGYREVVPLLETLKRDPDPVIKSSTQQALLAL